MKKPTLYIISLIIICICVYSSFAIAEEYEEFYPRLTVVFQIENINDCRIVYCIDRSQNVWSFFDDEFEYEPGDIINLLMWNNNSDITQHEIIEVYWEGYINNLNLFFEIDGWR